MKQRLDLMHDVARVKWNTKSPIHDPQREEESLRILVEEGKARGLDPNYTREFFTAQMNAAKLVQESDHERWRAEGRGPFTDAIELTLLRQRLDSLNGALLSAIVRVQPILKTEQGLRDFELAALAALGRFPPSVGSTATRFLRFSAPD
jgi:chorismate mutase-like protein